MKILKKYLLKEFTGPFISFLFFCCLIFLVSEFFFRLPDFLHHKIKFYLILYYLIRHTPLWIKDAMPIAILASITYTFNRMHRDNEITAIKSSGINLYNVISPILFSGVLLSLFCIFLNLNIVPSTYVAVKTIREYQMKGIKPTQQTIWYNLVYSGSNGEKFTIGFYDYSKKAMRNVTIDYLDEKFVLIRQLKAQRMEYRDRKWVLYDIIEQTFDVNTQEILNEKKYKSKLLTISDKPEDFLPSLINPEEMKLTELIKEIQRLKKHGMKYKKQLVEYHFRFAYSFANAIVILFGIPFGLGLSKKHGRIRSLVYVIVISAIYWIFVSFSRSLSTAQVVPAFLGVWSANIIFLLFGFILFLKIQR